MNSKTAFSIDVYSAKLAMIPKACKESSSITKIMIDFPKIQVLVRRSVGANSRHETDMRAGANMSQFNFRLVKTASVLAMTLSSGVAAPALAVGLGGGNDLGSVAAVAIGNGATTPQAGGVAIGEEATADGPSPTNPLFASVAVGYQAKARDNGVAIGNNAQALFSGTATPLATGFNSAVANGAGAVAVGANTVAVGTTSRAGIIGTAGVDPATGDVVNAGSDITAVGGRANATRNGATAIGGQSRALAENATAVGSGARAVAVDTVAVGSGASALQAGGIAIGRNASATGPSATNTIFSSIAIGNNAVAHDNATAIGNNAIARFSGTVTPFATGINSAIAHGAGAVAVGSNATAIGTTARAGTIGTAGVVPSNLTDVDGGANTTAVGGRAFASQSGATALGAQSRAAAGDATAVGNGAVVTASNAVAIGAGSIAGDANTVSFGSSGNTRRLTNVSDGVAATDGATVGQLNALGTTVATHTTQIAALQASSAGAAAAIATAAAVNATQDTRLTAIEGVNATQNTAIADVQSVNATQNTRLTGVENVNTAQAASITAIEGVNATQNTRLTALDTLTASLGSQVSSLQGQTATLFALSAENREGVNRANEGVALALAMESPALPAGTSFAISGGVGYYQSQSAFSAAFTTRTGPNSNFSAGLGYGLNSGEVGARAGFQAAW